MKKIFFFLLTFSMKIVFAQHNLTAAPWHDKVESALALIEEHDVLIIVQNLGLI